MRKLDDVTMRDLLPPGFRDDPDALAASAAIEEDYRRLYGLASQAIVFAGVDRLAGAWLDLLAEDLHVDYYDRSLPVERKRELVRRSIPMHRRKGTPGAVEELIRIVFGSGHVKEWWEYGGQPYHFKVVSSNPLATPEDARNFLAALDSVKNLRSVLEEIQINRTWGDVLKRDYLTWQNVLGLHLWEDVRRDLWSAWKERQWKDALGSNTWGNVCSYIWEDEL